MKNKKVKLFALITIIIYTAIMIFLMFFLNRRTSNEYSYNLKPFKSIKEYFKIRNHSELFQLFVVNIFGNIGMFILFGILLPLLFNGYFLKSFIIFEIGIITIEIMQLITRRGVFDVDDIILNAIGFLTGYMIITIINKLINKFRRQKQT